ncbi:unnamed protein product [Prorocentrum cordatum]|uniref:WW domain-containing protein n=1 Tax=Prorocentrum cordatum TaxID=2364126 RepID=A0ABN9Q393_9DINO|nr:unnamed protein product [Polarella glacialis]
MMWEDSLFGGAYGRSSAFERVKYGTINVINDPAGVRACAQYGRSYLLLRRCRLRTTFSAQDSAGLETEDLATDHYAHVLLRFGDGALRDVLHVATQRVLAVPSGVLDTYREAQVHGEVALAEHVEVVVADPALRLVDRDRLAAEQLARHCSSQVVWIEGDSLPPTPRAAESAGQPLAPAAAAPGPAPSGAAPTSADAPAAALVGAGALGAESGDEGQAPSELLALVLGAAGPSAEANGTYVLRPSAADCERCFAKVGAAPVCLLLETSEGFERWRIGVSDGAGCLLRSAPLPQGHGGDPSEVAVWFSEVPSGGWERQESARVVLRRVPCGTAERMWASGLPAGWDLTQDPGSGRTYYFDWETRRTSWQRPGEQ